MSTAVVPAADPGPLPGPVLGREEVEAAKAYAAASRAPGTRRAYAADWRGFLAWCEARGAPALPADPRLRSGQVGEGRIVARGPGGTALSVPPSPRQIQSRVDHGPPTPSATRCERP